MIPYKAMHPGKRSVPRSALFFMFFTFMAPAVFSQTPPPDQPSQIRSEVVYDEKLKDPFFEKEQWSTGDPNLGQKKVKRLHSAKCVTDHQLRHTIRFCDAQFLPDGTLQLYIHDFSASTFDNLLVLVKDQQFSCQYWTAYMVKREDEGLIWTTKTQKLVLKKKSYHKGERIKGKIEFECLQEVTNPKYGGRFPVNIKIEGVFKSVIK